MYINSYCLIGDNYLYGRLQYLGFCLEMYVNAVFVTSCLQHNEFNWG